MTPGEVLRLRLENHALTQASFRAPQDVVAWFGAMQAQDYLGSLWAIGLRMKSATEALVESAETQRKIVRTWPMRGTLHFVAAADVHWMTALLAPRVMARNAARMKRDFGVDASLIARCRDIVARALEGGARLERSAVYEALEARKVRTGNSRGLHILLCLAMDGSVCLAGRQDKQHTFAWLDDWIRPGRQLSRDEALAELARRYFTSRGPASIQDFMWWAGITAKDARIALEGAAPGLSHEKIEGREYWWKARRSKVRKAPGVSAKLLPAYDEYTVAYQDRAWLVDSASRLSKMDVLGPVAVVDGRVAGLWKRTLGPDGVTVAFRKSRRWRGEELDELTQAARRFGDFLGLKMRIAPR